MDIGRIIFGAILLAAGLVMFLVEFKILPYMPSNPEKWDELHTKHFRVIKLSNKILLLLGLTFLFTGINQGAFN
ncbi:MAG: hypothetical protein FWC36_03575 [Spirochaetes bacterium]|nr:hypothetical protein [Spirochaetota bacterium]